MGASTIAELKQQVHHTIQVLQDSFQNLAALLNPGMANQLNLLSAMYRDSRNPLTADVIRLTEDEKEQIRQAILLRRESVQTLETYLQAIDEDDINGSIRGLPRSMTYSTPDGGHVKEGDPVIVPPKQPVIDVSRHRISIYLELLPQFAMAELRASDGILDLRYQWIDRGGHTVGRHDSNVTDIQLRDRVTLGRDPMTGSEVDWQKGTKHGFGKHATTFTSREALVYAEARIWISDEGGRYRSDAEASGRENFEVRLTAIEIFGPTFRQHLRGQTRIGSRSRSQGSAPTTFTDQTTVYAKYERESPDSPWRLLTCYAEPEGPNK